MADAYRWLGVVPLGAEKIRERRRNREARLRQMARWGLRPDGTRPDAEDSAGAPREPATALAPAVSCQASSGSGTAATRLLQGPEDQVARRDTHPQRPTQ